MKKDAFMTRSFLPIGQGAFYCEHFGSDPGNRINIVYDCGSTTDINNLFMQIDNSFEEGEEITALFISHFDDDHINGIEHLLKRCSVQNVFLPVITPMDKGIISVDIYLKSFKINDLLNDPAGLIHNYSGGRNARIYAVRPIDTVDSDDDDDYLTLDDDAPVLPSVEFIDSGIDVGATILGMSSIVKTEWKYVPFNFRNRSKFKKIMDAISAEYGYTVHSTDLLDLAQTSSLERKRIRKVYKDVFPGTAANINSMTLYSGPNDMPDLYQYDMYAYRVVSEKRPGCLYFGDYDISGKQKWETLRKCYEPYWNEIGCVQVPHHGSNRNFNSELITTLDAFYVISAGTANKYQHPHANVMRKFISSGILPHLVTELPSSAYYTYCELA